MNEREEIEFYQLCDELLEGTINPERREKLNTVLRNSQSAREAYVRRSSLHTSLAQYGDKHFSDSENISEPITNAQSSKTRIFKRLNNTLPKIAAVFAIGFFLTIFLLPQLGLEVFPTNVADAETEEATYQGAAVLIQTYQVDWGEGNHAYAIGDSIPEGRFRMKSGVAQLEFYSGATMILEGNADLEIQSPEKAYCHFGKMSVSVSAHARGFSIETSDHEFIDLGTEFGLSVEKGKPSELHVFSGEVEVYNRDRSPSTEPVQTLETGNAARFSVNSQSNPVSLRSNDFWNLQKLSEQTDEHETDRFKTWLKFSQHLALDKDIIGYFPFYETKPWVRKLENIVESADDFSHGAIVGSQWQKGRWPEKSALQFSNPSDRVRFNIRGEYKSLTFSAWVRIESLNNAYNGLCITDSFLPGNPHWQITNKGKLQLGIRNTTGKGDDWQHFLESPPLLSADFINQWIHLASTYDGQTTQITHYLNGKRLNSKVATVPTDFTINFGPGELGNWGLPQGQKEHKIRNLDGSMDEFILFSRALQAEEILKLYKVGQP